MPETVVAVRELTFGEAVREGAGGRNAARSARLHYRRRCRRSGHRRSRCLSGLVEEFGQNRVLDTPISEAGFTGIGVGAAMTGLRPVVDIMFGDFVDADRWTRW